MLCTSIPLVTNQGAHTPAPAQQAHQHNHDDDDDDDGILDHDDGVFQDTDDDNFTEGSNDADDYDNNAAEFLDNADDTTYDSINEGAYVLKDGPDNVLDAPEANIMTRLATNEEFAHTMTQKTTKAGLKKYGRKSEEALLAEFAQLENLDVYEPLDPSKLTRAQKKQTVRAIKKSGAGASKAKWWGRPQRNLYDKSETASPTVATD
jgi:hypothetical protein